MMSSKPTVILYIPARYRSQRFPGKLLQPINGQSILHRIWDIACSTKYATDCRIVLEGDLLEEEAVAIGAAYIRSSEEYICGTDRCIAALDPELDYSYLLNVQADQPFLKAEIIDQLILFLTASPDVPIASVMTLKTCDDPRNQIVKVNIDDKGYAKGFYRALGNDGPYFRHIGIYGFNRSAVEAIKLMRPTANEKVHSLEQLRWMDHGWRIKMLGVDYDPRSVDIPDDLNGN